MWWLKVNKSETTTQFLVFSLLAKFIIFRQIFVPTKSLTRTASLISWLGRNPVKLKMKNKVTSTISHHITSHHIISPFFDLELKQPCEKKWLDDTRGRKHPCSTKKTITCDYVLSFIWTFLLQYKLLHSSPTHHSICHKKTWKLFVQMDVLSSWIPTNQLFPSHLASKHVLTA